MAIQQFDSVEKYMESVQYNLDHFSEIMEKKLSRIPEDLRKRDLFLKLASLRDKAASSDEVQQTMREIIAFVQGNAPSETFVDREHYCYLRFYYAGIPVLYR